MRTGRWRSGTSRKDGRKRVIDIPDRFHNSSFLPFISIDLSFFLSKYIYIYISREVARITQDRGASNSMRAEVWPRAGTVGMLGGPTGRCPLSFLFALPSFASTSSPIRSPISSFPLPAPPPFRYWTRLTTLARNFFFLSSFLSRSPIQIPP